MIQVTEKEFKLFQDLLEELSGIKLSEYQSFLVENRLQRLLVSTHSNNFGELFLLIKQKKSLSVEMIDLLSINETFWFRDAAIWKAIEENFLPEFIKSKLKEADKTLRIWSCACSMGQEPYSFAILIDEVKSRMMLEPDELQVEIIASDISESSLNIAQQGKYSHYALSRGLSESRILKYFETTNKEEYLIKDKIKKMVKFISYNLMDDFTFIMDKVDLVLCRNVAIYFPEKFKEKLFENIASIMKPKSFMLLGSSETLLGCRNSFEKVNESGIILYRVKK